MAEAACTVSSEELSRERIL